MEAQLTQAGTYAAQSYSQSYFRLLPTDERFLQVSYQKFPCNTSLDSKTLQFQLNRFEAANIYLIQNTCLEVQVVILKADGTSLPDIAKKVAPVANVLHSLWEKVKLEINDTEITKSSTCYPYKAYISSTLTYPNTVKACQLQTEGLYLDLNTHFGPTDVNTGFVERSKLFRTNNDDTKAYKREGVKFFGRLQLDLLACQTGLIPNTKVLVELTRADDAFVLLRQKGDTENYQLKVLNCNLYVPIAQLAAPTYNELSRLLTERSVPLHFRRIEIIPLSLNSGKEEYNSDNLFPSEIPCRIVIAFVVSKNKTGSYDTNPFEFNRKWKVKVQVNKPQSTDALSTNLSEREKQLEAKVLEFQRQLELFKSCLDPNLLSSASKTSKNSGRGRKNRSDSIFTRLRQSLGGQDETRSLTSENSVRPSTSCGQEASLPPRYSDIEEPTLPSAEVEKTIYIKAVELFLNGAPLDQIDTRKLN